MNFGLIIVGDEILSGKRQDKHLPKVIELLAARGLSLGWARYVGDERTRITAVLRDAFGGADAVFCCGGIGATPDDHTRQCAAAALGVGLALHPEAEREIRGRFSGETTPQRLKMGEFPIGADIIPNPFNRIPGFSIREHWFVPGFPQMAWPMLEWVLDTKYRHLFDRDRWAEASVIVYLPESTIAPLMVEINAKYKGLKAFSLPSMGEDATRRHIELGVRGAPAEVEPAIADIRRGIHALGGRVE